MRTFQEEFDNFCVDVFDQLRNMPETQYRDFRRTFFSGGIAMLTLMSTGGMTDALRTELFEFNEAVMRGEK